MIGYKAIIKNGEIAVCIENELEDGVYVLLSPDSLKRLLNGDVEEVTVMKMDSVFASQFPSSISTPSGVYYLSGEMEVGKEVASVNYITIDKVLQQF